MRAGLLTVVLVGLAIGAVSPALGEAPRKDTIWARNATDGGTITLNGILSEPAWAFAESMIVRYPLDAGIPGSGWKGEAGANPSDSTYATLKLLVHGNQMYLGAVVRDKSVGGSKDFNRFDGFIMALKDHADAYAPKPPSEYVYLWWYPTLDDPQPPGQSPAFVGRWATWPPGTPRTPEQIDAWDAVTVVHGQSNNDGVPDTGYTVEMRFNLTPMGYDVTKTDGDIIEWNISIYDCDWFWPFQASMSSNRVWWQSPWGNAMWYDEVHVFAKPSVGLYNQLPVIGPEVRIPNGANETTPVINGRLDDQIWSRIRGFDIRFGDAALRQTYPGVGPWRAGQYQPTVNGGLAAVLDPGNATVKMFFKGNTLYMGFDVRDEVVQYHANVDRWDGFIVSLNDVVQRSPDHVLLGRRLTFQVNQDGTALPQDYLATLVQEGGAQVALYLKPGTTVDTLGTSPDVGYQAEMTVDLTRLGYPVNLGDGSMFLGVDLLDGDSFDPPSDSYGTKTWWFREHEGYCCPAWVYLDPNLFVADVAEPSVKPLLVGDAHPNPFEGSTSIRYSLAQASDVHLEIFDVQGRLVAKEEIGLRPAGEHTASFDGTNWAAGIYLYRLGIIDPRTGAERSGPFGRMVLLK